MIIKKQKRFLMMHVRLLVEATPEKHKEFVNTVENLQYSAEGEFRTGFVSPQISEIKLYDVRILEEHAQKFLKNVGAMSLNRKHKGNSKFHKINIFNFFVRIIMKLFGMKQIEPDLNEAKKVKGWQYVVNLGESKDPGTVNPLTNKKKNELL